MPQPKPTSILPTLKSLNKPTSAPLTNTPILHAYRHLLRNSLRAVHYSTPARHVVLSRLRLSFRSSPSTDFEPMRIANTLTFLQNAAATTGMEHNVLRSLLKVWYWEPAQWKERKGRQEERAVKEGAYEEFYWNLRMLNESMRLCLR